MAHDRPVGRQPAATAPAVHASPGRLRSVTDQTGAFSDFVVLAKEGARSRQEWPEVERLGTELRNHIALVETRQRLLEANQPGLASTVVQASITPFLQQCGFRSEARGLFADYEPRNLRPDFYLKIGDSGVLLEVERGKTIDNNMDILDFWKTHICPHADHLFLLVPTEYRSNAKNRPTNLFLKVYGRLSTFFEPENLTNVESVSIFGY